MAISPRVAPAAPVPRSPVAGIPVGLLARPARPRLDRELDATLGPATRLTLVSAPPGYGKSVAVAHWVAASGAPAAWLTLSDAHDDPARLAADLLSALDGARPGSGALAALIAPGALSGPAALARLIGEAVEADDRDTVIVLDDVHAVTSPDGRALVRSLAQDLPPFARLVLVTREDPVVPLGRLRAHGALVELRGDDLRFTRDEAAAFLLTRAWSPSLPSWTGCSDAPRAGPQRSSWRRSRSGQAPTPAPPRRRSPARSGSSSTTSPTRSSRRWTRTCGTSSSASRSRTGSTARSRGRSPDATTPRSSWPAPSARTCSSCRSTPTGAGTGCTACSRTASGGSWARTTWRGSGASPPLVRGRRAVAEAITMALAAGDAGTGRPAHGVRGPGRLRGRGARHDLGLARCTAGRRGGRGAGSSSRSTPGRVLHRTARRRGIAAAHHLASTPARGPAEGRLLILLAMLGTDDQGGCRGAGAARASSSSATTHCSARLGCWRRASRSSRAGNTAAVETLREAFAGPALGPGTRWPCCPRSTRWVMPCRRRAGATRPRPGAAGPRRVPGPGRIAAAVAWSARLVLGIALYEGGEVGEARRELELGLAAAAALGVGGPVLGWAVPHLALARQATGDRRGCARHPPAGPWRARGGRLVLPSLAGETEARIRLAQGDVAWAARWAADARPDAPAGSPILALLRLSADLTGRPRPARRGPRRRGARTPGAGARGVRGAGRRPGAHHRPRAPGRRAARDGRAGPGRR